MLLEESHRYEELDLTAMQHEPMSTNGRESTAIDNLRTITNNKGNKINKKNQITLTLKISMKYLRKIH